MYTTKAYKCVVYTTKAYKYVMCIQQRHTSVSCVCIQLNRWLNRRIDDSMVKIRTHTHTHTHIVINKLWSCSVTQHYITKTHSFWAELNNLLLHTQNMEWAPCRDNCTLKGMCGIVLACTIILCKTYSCLNHLHSLLSHLLHCAFDVHCLLSIHLVQGDVQSNEGPWTTHTGTAGWGAKYIYIIMVYR